MGERERRNLLGYSGSNQGHHRPPRAEAYGLGSTFPLGRTAHSHGAHGGLTVVTPLNAGPSTRIVGVQLVVTSSATASRRPRRRPRRAPEDDPPRELGGEDPREPGTHHRRVLEPAVAATPIPRNWSNWPSDHGPIG